jgi:hypothetical protein
MKRKSTTPSSDNKFPREGDDALQIQELINAESSAELDAPWVFRRFYSTLKSSLRKWVGG